ncbi:IPExxxVDY family protein [Fulvivirga sp. 29W222]|uniref:IPExxxVDY family protein n=1 Tax=Fulvivirga marina TaxID=2494733 RepID=A0A937FT72_9BACT|nr:IPExxxVDY family protein [Fulvivirga marina]MBL6445240.1 IPExxxVDY family protein [Fulvivirga marina]
MKKTKLIVEYEYEFELIGIISSIKFYKLAWAINKKLDVRLVKQDDYSMEMKGGNLASFSNYLYQMESSCFRLFKNRSVEGENASLIPELPHFDYIIKIDEQSQSFAKEEILKELKEVQWIEYIAAIEVETLKSKDNFLT